MRYFKSPQDILIVSGGRWYFTDDSTSKYLISPIFIENLPKIGYNEVYVKPCCSNPLPVGTLTNDQVKCLNCGEETRLQDLPNYNDPFYYDPPASKPSKSLVICECGSDKTYGVNSVTHSSWCPMYRTP